MGAKTANVCRNVFFRVYLGQKGIPNGSWNIPKALGETYGAFA